jgi:ribosomal protein RSM22 (predicted rRNA methylase)
LPRTKIHKALKGAEVPFEDEPYSYVIATRTERPRATARILRAPRVSKAAADLVLCTPDGVETIQATRREKAMFTAARRADAGDAWPE